MTDECPHAYRETKTPVQIRRGLKKAIVPVLYCARCGNVVATETTFDE